MAGVTRSPRVWVFDVDDTLYLERDYVRSGFAAVGEHLAQTVGVPDFAATCWQLYLAGSRGDIFNRALALNSLETPENLVQSLIEIYRSHRPSISLAESVLAMLQRLRETARTAAVTGGSPLSQQMKVQALGLDALLDPIIYAGSRGTALDKPDSWSWREVEEATGHRGSELAYIGDNPIKDFSAPQQLGWRAVRLRLPDSEHQTLSTPSGIPQASSLDEAIGILQA